MTTACPCRLCSVLHDTPATEIYTLSLHDALPFCTAILADLGAEVIKVEAPRAGDEGRYGYPTADGVPIAFLALNRSEEHTSELQSRENLVCRLLLEKKKEKSAAGVSLPPFTATTP